MLRAELELERGPLQLTACFTIEPGERLALVGPSGAGKSTVLRLLAGLLRPDRGRITLGEEVWLDRAAGIEVPAERRRVGLVFQDYALFPRMSAWRNVAYGVRGGERRRRAGEMLARFGLADRAGARPSELSGGERQRVAIARALAAEPTLVICDEITSSLDVSVQAAVLELLQELRAALWLSLLFITHDLGVVSSIADRVVVLKDGALCESGDVDQVLDNPASAYTRELLAAAPSLREALLPSDLGARKTAPDAGAGGGM